MKKAIFFMMLFLTFSFVLTAQQYHITKQVVGTGGFIVKTQDGRVKSAGLFGQAMTGSFNININGASYMMYLGFWSGFPNGVGIDDYVTFDRGISNYPNPVVDLTYFKFNLKEPSFITINVYNSIGMFVARVMDNQVLSEGDHSIPWNIALQNDAISAGAYSYEMISVPAYSSSDKAAFFSNTLMITK